MKFLFFIFLFNFHFNVYSSEGTTGAAFLKISRSARESALAGAYSSVGNDSNSIFSNPASLVKTSKKEFSLGFTSYIQGSKLGLFSYSWGKDDYKIGLGLSLFNVGDIERRGSADISGIMDSDGSFDSNDMAFIFGYSKKGVFKNILDDLSGGVNLKIIRSKLDSKTAYALAVDLGFLYEYSKNINLSFAVSNLGTKIKFEEESDSLPLSLKAGGYYSIKENFKLIGEIEEYINDSKFYPSVAFEYMLKESFALRGGYRFGYDTSNLGWDAGLSIGFGVITSDVGFNYAYVPFGELGDTNRFDIVFKF